MVGSYMLLLSNEQLVDVFECVYFCKRTSDVLLLVVMMEASCQKVRKNLAVRVRAPKSLSPFVRTSDGPRKYDEKNKEH